MEIKPPPPIVSAYSVMELMVLNHPQTGKPYLSHRDGRVGRSGERYVNTIDIEVQYLLPSLFIIGWQEFHYEVYYDNSGTPRYQEVAVTRTHRENMERILKIRNAWNDYFNTPDIPFTVPKMVSLEQELHGLGWVFQYQADVGPIYNLDLEAQINWAIPQNEGSIDAFHVPVEKEWKNEPIEILKPQEPVINRLESKIDSLTDAVFKLVGVMSSANGHHTGTTELCPTDAPPRNRKRVRRNATGSSADTIGA